MATRGTHAVTRGNHVVKMYIVGVPTKYTFNVLFVDGNIKIGTTLDTIEIPCKA